MEKEIWNNKQIMVNGEDILIAEWKGKDFFYLTIQDITYPIFEKYDRKDIEWHIMGIKEEQELCYEEDLEDDLRYISHYKFNGNNKEAEKDMRNNLKGSYVLYGLKETDIKENYNFLRENTSLRENEYFDVYLYIKEIE